MWGSADTLHCDTFETDDFLSQDPVHSEVTYEQCLAFSRGILQASKAEASDDSEHQSSSLGKGQEQWPFRQCFSKHSSLERSGISANDVCFEDSDATIDCCQDVEMQDVDDQAFVEIESEPFGAAKESSRLHESHPRPYSRPLVPSQRHLGQLEKSSHLRAVHTPQIRFSRNSSVCFSSNQLLTSAMLVVHR